MVFNIFYQIKYQKFLNNLKVEQEGLFKYTTKKNFGRKSTEHFLIKIYILKILVERRNLPLDREIIRNIIKTEFNLKKITADIYLEDIATVYEIETLFGTGREGNEPMDKLIYTIEKYAEISNVKNIKIVLENFTLIRHINNLLEIKSNFKSWEEKHQKKVGFLTLDIENNTLIPLNNIISKIKTILRDL